MKNFDKLLKENEILSEEWRSFDEPYYGIDSKNEYYTKNAPELCKLGLKIKCVENFGGEEGDGSTRYVVFSVEKDGVITFYKLDGFYQSYVGTEWDDKCSFYEVEQVEVMVKEWHALRGKE